MVRCGRSANIELFDYSAPNQRTDFPKNSDWAGHHIAFYVTDIDAAVQYMVAHGAQKFLGPLPVTDGPAAGQSINYFRTPFGTYIELISYPNGMAYERDPGRPLWSPKRNGTTSTVTSVPGLLGIDHVGITVPNVAEAVAWFENVLGCTPAHLRAVLGRRDVIAPRRRSCRGRRAHPARALRRRPERRALPVLGAWPGPHVPPELRLRREAHRVLRPAHRQGGGAYMVGAGRREAARPARQSRTGRPPASRSTTSGRRSGRTSS